MSRIDLRPTLLVLVAAAIPVGVAHAQSVDAEWGTAALRLRPAADPVLVEELDRQLTPAVSLPAARTAAAVEIGQIAAWNRAGRRPARNGFSRELPLPLGVDLDRTRLPGLAAAVGHGGGLLLRSGADTVLWGGEIEVAGAVRLRLRLSEVALPASARLWVSGRGARGEGVVRRGPFGLELLDPEGGLWTPSVAGERIRLEVELPASPIENGREVGWVLDRVVEIVPLDELGAPMLGGPEHGRAQDCLVESACVDDREFPSADLVEAATARVAFMRGGASFLCSGALLADTDPTSFIPYFLTANHCIDTESEARSVEAFWDFVSAGCGGRAPTLGELERSNGSSRLATGRSSDFTLLELFEVPAERGFLGWDSDPGAVADGTVLHRLSHPFGRPQHYSRSRVDVSFPVCTGVPMGRFVYGFVLRGGTFGGSSGGVIVDSAGRALGQLFGGCGPTNPDDGCDRENAEVDGAFAASFPSLARFLTTPCAASPTELCLRDDRFRVEVSWRDASGNEGVGRRVIGVDSEESGLFYFFAEANWEVLVKVLDGCDVNGHLWVYYAATTDVELALTVTDTWTGRSKRYSNRLGEPAEAITDAGAFACP